MSITINNSKITLLNETPNPELVAQLKLQIKKLPEPIVIFREAAEDLRLLPSPDNSVICLQHEAAYIELFSPISTIRYVGSKNVVNCIVVALSSETDCLILHCDNIGEVAFKRHLEKFKSRQNINVALVGGCAGSTSEEILSKIIHNLVSVACQLKLNLNFVAQTLIERNKFTEEGKYAFIYDLILHKAAELYKIICKKPFPHEQIKRKVSDLKARSLSNTSCPDKQRLGKFCKLLLITETLPSKEVQFLLDDLFGKISTEKLGFEILKLSDALLSKEGFSIIGSIVDRGNAYPCVALSNFVFDLNSPELKIVCISALLGTPNEALRRLFAFEIQRKPQDYHLCYDGSATKKYAEPKLTPEFELACELNRELIRSKVYYTKEEKQKFLQSFPLPKICLSLKPAASTMAQFIMERLLTELEQTNQSSKAPTCWSFFKQSVSLESIYKASFPCPIFRGSSIKPIPTKLAILREVTGIDFQAFEKRSLDYTVDAISMYDTKEAAEIQQRILANKKIPNEMVEIGKGVYYLCVPAINVEYYAKFIQPL
jgi:hypothetical protein